MTSEIARILRTEDRFLVVTHINPDGDALGSLLGTALALAEMGKRSCPLSADRIPDMYDFLPGRDRVVSDANLVPFKPDWLLALDTATEQRISGDLSLFRTGGARLINLDHHVSNPHYGDLNLVRPQATSTAEIVLEILKQAGYTLSQDVAKCLYTGLITDTGCFRFSGVDSRTLEVGAELLATGFDSYAVTLHLFEENSFARVQLERLILDRLEVLLDGQLALSMLYAEDFGRVGADRSEMENLVDKLREIRGVEVGVLITESANGPNRVSFRSKGRVDVSALASPLGGGGHRSAAGLRIELPLDQIKEKITKAVSKALAESANPGHQT
jgi:phosphoesterase RecJ-like protein